MWSEKLREQVLGAFDNLLDLLGLIQVREREREKRGRLIIDKQ